MTPACNCRKDKQPLLLSRLRVSLALSLSVALQMLPASTYADTVTVRSTRLLPVSMESKAKSKLTILDSKSPVAADNVGKRLFWISNEEVLFVGYLAALISSDKRASKRPDYNVSVWNVRTNAIRILRSFGENSPTPCFSDGHVLVQIRQKDGEHRSYYGDTSDIKLAAPGQRFNELFCRPVEQVPSLPTWTERREVRLLEKFGAGFVDFGERTGGMENTPARLYKFGTGDREGVQLPVGRRDIEKAFPYYTFKDAFFVESSYVHWPRPKGVPYPVYWLYPDGRMEQIIDLPWGPWRSSASSWPLPTKVGVLLVSHNANIRNEKDLAHAGLYVMSAGKVAKLITAWIQATAVSPSGCRVAFDFADRVTRAQNVLRAIDLCNGELK